MRQKFKNSRQKEQSNSGSINKLFNELVLNFCHNLKGYCQFLHITAKKLSGIAEVSRSIFLCSLRKIGLVANNYKFWLVGSKYSLILFCFLVPITTTMAQNVSINVDGQDTATGTIFRLLVLTTVLSLAPSILMMVTSFTRIIIVLSLLRSAIGIQQTPPNVVLISLALFLTFFIMQPTFEKSYNEGIKPLIDNKIDEKEALSKTAEPFREFMLKHVREDDLALFTDLSGVEVAKDAKVKDDKAVPYRTLIPAFMVSELRRAFEIGFLIFIPFLIIDMVVASILMSMGMMMLPPVLISLPFKIIFFVLIDGWAMLSESLVKSFQ